MSMKNSSEISPKLSILVTTFNSQETVENVILALLSSDVKGGSEIIVVDDCSTDKTVELLKRDFPMVRVISLTVNSGGPAFPRNTAIKAARGEFILFCDGDDLLNVNYIRSAVDILNTGNFDLVSSKRKVINSQEDFDIHRMLEPLNVITISYGTLTLKDRITFSGTTIRSDLLKVAFNETKNLVGFEDYLFLLDNIKNGLVAARIEHRGVGYLVTGNNISRNKLSRIPKLYRMNRIHGRSMVTASLFTGTHNIIAFFEKVLKAHW